MGKTKLDGAAMKAQQRLKNKWDFLMISWKIPSVTRPHWYKLQKNSQTKIQLKLSLQNWCYVLKNINIFLHIFFNVPTQCEYEASGGTVFCDQFNFTSHLVDCQIVTKKKIKKTGMEIEWFIILYLQNLDEDVYHILPVS